MLLAIFLITGIFWVGSLKLLERQYSRYSSFSFDDAETKKQVLKWMGAQPTWLIDPTYSLDGEPIPNTAYWRYRLHVKPFKIDIGLEFQADLLVGISRMPADDISFLDTY